MDLAARFDTLWSRAGLRDPLPVFEQLRRQYTEPSRAYHNLAHIEHMLAEYDGSGVARDDAVELSIWFHDAIYDSTLKDSEERSATFARASLYKAGAGEELVANVERLILATRHVSAPMATDEKLLVDCDLAILGQPRERFAHYEAAIRREYAWVPDDAFGAGRSAVLEQFLNRPAIYALPYFSERYETAARENLRYALAELRC
jgi:predicted metal-dependent HD superfamily phosphohydrolase